jgi:nucleotide-binding universal stress UspA family protein
LIDRHELVYSKILVPYDGSEQANKALDHAVILAKADPGRPQVVLLHVIEDFPNYHLVDRPAASIRTGKKITLSKYYAEVHSVMSESAKEALESKKGEIKKLHGYEIKTAISTGHAADNIRKYAEDKKVDLIVIGNVGRTGLSRLRTLGSVSRAISEKAPCPVMIIH